MPENSGEEEEADAHYGADYPQQRHDNHSDTNRVTCDVTSPFFFLFVPFQKSEKDFTDWYKPRGPNLLACALFHL